MTCSCKVCNFDLIPVRLKENTLNLKKIVMKKTFLFCFVFLILSNDAYSQNLNDRLQKVGEEYATMYLQPLVDALGTNLNSNYFYSAKIPFDPKLPVDANFGIRLRFMNTFLGSSDESFDLSYSEVGVVNGQQVVGTYTVTNAPTILGEEQAPVARFTYQGVAYPENDVELIAGVIKTSVVPFVLPEITFGTVYGTDAALFFLPSISVSDFGSFSSFGFSLRYNLSRYFENSPVDVALMGGYQNMSVTETDNNNLWSSNNFFVNTQVSKTFSMFTAYSALQYENFSADISYNYIRDGNTHPVAISLEGDNNFRAIIGGTVRAGFFAFNLDANIGKRFAVSSGLNFILR